MTLPDKSLLDIHENALDQDCRQHPQLTYEWGVALAEARAHAKRCKNKLEVLKAEVTKKFRNRPMSFGLDKATEGLTEAVVDMDDGVKKATDDLISAEHDVDILAAFVQALRDRRDALTDMVKLHGQMYWSKPDTSTDQDQAARTARIGSRKDRT